MLINFKKQLANTYLLSFPFFVRFIPQSIFRFLFLFTLKCMGIETYDSSFKFEKQIYKKLKIKPNAVFFDVGANVGTYRDFILKTYSQSHIFCFEPHPQSFKLLKQNNHSKQAKVFNIGFAAQQEKKKIYDYTSESSHEHASLHSEVISTIHKQKPKSFAVLLSTIDNFCHENRISSIDVLKIDTEGSEYEVLLGAKNMLDSGSVKHIHFEFNRMNTISRVFFKDFFDLLKNYDLYRITADRLVPIINYDPLYCEIFGYQNFVASLKK